MYEIEGRIYEKHGEYNCYLAVWSTDEMTKTMLFSLYETKVALEGDTGDEHSEILYAIMSSLSRHSRKVDVPFL